LAHAFPTSIAKSIADLGFVHTADETLKEKELLLLCYNGKSSSGETCVLPHEELSGWVIRNNEFVQVSKVSSGSIHMAKLVEKSKVLRISSSGK
jgi:hypothetical protein